jgi:carbamoylphosphate synthase large subunit
VSFWTILACKFASAPARLQGCFDQQQPATIMTDPATAGVTHNEPITWRQAEKNHR